MTQRIVFFNQFHNGDCFVGKGWVRNIMRQVTNAEFYYAHKNHPSIVSDLGCTHLTLEEIPAIDRMVRIARDDTDGTIYINTWCGAFQGELFGYNQHSNYIVQHRMYELICAQLSQALGYQIVMTTNPHDYLPFIDFDRFDVSDSVNFAGLFGDFTLICNGNAMSGQSGVGDLKNVINNLCINFPNQTFVATHDVGLRHTNLHYTSDIFKMESDLNQIAHLSKFASLIVGKNSGPFTYCQYKDNMERKDVTFFCFGKLLTDCLNAGLEFPARFKFSDQVNEQIIYGMLYRHLIAADPGYRTGMQHITV